MNWRKPLSLLLALCLIVGLCPALAVPAEAADSNGFEIVGTTLIKYTGPGGDVTIPGGVTVIADDAFNGCETLTGVTIPDSVTSIGWGSFRNCTSLKSVTMPEGVKTIGSYCFDNCTSLRSVVLPKQITSLPHGCFQSCEALTSVTLWDGLAAIEPMCFYGCTKLADVVLPEGLTSIKNNAFGNCTSLRDIKLPGTVTELDQWSFANSGLTSIDLPDGLKTMGKGCFTGCVMPELRIPASVTTLDPLANKQSDNKIKKIIFEGTDLNGIKTTEGQQPSIFPDVAVYLQPGTVKPEWLKGNTVQYLTDETPRYRLTVQGSENDELDLGAFTPTNGSEASRSIGITNTGTEPLNLTVQTSSESVCRVSGPKEKTLAPNSSTNFSFYTKAGLESGSYTAKVTITTEEGLTVNLTVRFTVDAKVCSLSVEPATLDFGTVDVGYTQPEAKTVTITNTGDDTVNLLEHNLANEYYLLGKPGKTTLAVGESTTVTFQPKADLTGGSYHETIKYSCIKHSDSAVISIDLQFTVKGTPGLSVTPTELDFGHQALGYGRQDYKTVTITNTGSEAVTLNTLRLSNSDFEFFRQPSDGYTLEVGKSVEVSVQPKQSLWNGTYTGTLDIKASDGLSASVSLKFVVGSGVDEWYVQGVRFTPSKLEFDTAAEGYKTVTPKTINYTNNNSYALRQSFALSDSNFEITSKPSSSQLSPKEDASISVRPKDGLKRGTYTATLTVTLSIGDSLTDTMDVPLTFVVEEGDADYLISPDPDSLDFGTEKVGYTQPGARTVTISNTGKRSVTLQTPSSSSFVLGALSRTTLDAGQDATFTVRPKAGLKEGSYSEQIVVKTAQGASATISVNFTVGKKGPTFVDVKEDDWFFEDVEYAYEHGLMNGVGNNRFDPNGTTTRGQIVTILYRLEGEPAVSGRSSFADVASGQYYANAVKWASDHQIVNGYSSTKFGPNDPITREQMATILYRYADYKHYDVSARADLSKFTDAGSVSGYALDAISWANSQKLINGITTTTIVPQGSAIRAQAAAILHRFCENIAQ